VQVQPGAIGKIIDGLRARLDPWLDEPKRERAEASVTLLYRFESEIVSSLNACPANRGAVDKS
jgi:hypothetical protein